MSRCACGGILNLVWAGPGMQRLKCSNPWHEFPVEAFGDPVDAESLRQIEGPRLAEITVVEPSLEAASTLTAQNLATLTRALGRTNHDDTNGSGGGEGH